jgi:hypothetical protein
VTELNAYLIDCHRTLIHVAWVFGSASDSQRVNVLARAASLGRLSNEYRDELHTPILTTRKDMGKIPAAGAAQMASNALERLNAVISAGSYVEYPSDVHGPGRYDFQRKLDLRWNKLFQLRKDLRHVNMLRYEMEGTIPTEFYATILGKSPQTRPLATPGQAQAIIDLYAAGIPAGYIASVISPESLVIEEKLAQMKAMYAEGIPAEFAASIA